jgi:hypothetical protein
VTADQVRAGAAAQDAKKYAPSAFAHAEKLRREADEAFAAKDIAGAQILGERALAAYAQANVLARVTRAEVQARQADAALAAAKAELSALDADQMRVQAETDALELKVKVVRDAQPIVPSGPADPDREKARLAAARTLALQARLLCSAARLLMDGSREGTSSAPATAAAPSTTKGSASPASSTAPAEDLATAMAELGNLDAVLSAGGTAPIDGATRARAGCLAVLTNVRRAATPVARAPGAGDALLADLSKALWSPSRDDRGVFITLRGIFAGDALTPAGETRIAELGRVAAAHPAFPVAVVLHQDRESTPPQKATSNARADAVVRTLKNARVTRIEAVQAGAAAPVVDPNGSDRERNARVEIVFIMPEPF